MANKIECVAVVDEQTWHQHCYSKSFFSHAFYGHGHSHREKKKKFNNTRLKRAANVCETKKKIRETKNLSYQNVYTTLRLLHVLHVVEWKKMRRVDRWKQCSQWTCRRGRSRYLFSFYFSLSRTHAKLFGWKQNAKQFAPCSRCYRIDLIKKLEKFISKRIKVGTFSVSRKTSII